MAKKDIKSVGPVIDDNNYENFFDHPRGLWHFDSPLEHANCAGSFEDMGIPLIPESEWDDRIRAIEKDGATLREFALDMGMKVLNQGGTNYCWINAPTFCAMHARLRETGRVIPLSPASCGGPIKNFRNYGGWGSEGLDRMITHGINEQADWPANAIDSRYYTDENKRKALKHRVREYYVLRSWQERVSCILAGIPTADGYPWWRHEVSGVHITLKDHDLIIANSWNYTWGDQGYGTLKGNRKMAGDSVAITAMWPI